MQIYTFPPFCKKIERKFHRFLPFSLPLQKQILKSENTENAMKAAEIFKQYIWLTETIRRAGSITLHELNERWVRTEMSGWK